MQEHTVAKLERSIASELGVYQQLEKFRQEYPIVDHQVQALQWLFNGADINQMPSCIKVLHNSSSIFQVEASNPQAFSSLTTEVADEINAKLSQIIGKELDRLEQRALEYVLNNHPPAELLTHFMNDVSQILNNNLEHATKPLSLERQMMIYGQERQRVADGYGVRSSTDLKTNTLAQHTVMSKAERRMLVEEDPFLVANKMSPEEIKDWFDQQVEQVLKDLFTYQLQQLTKLKDVPGQVMLIGEQQYPQESLTVEQILEKVATATVIDDATELNNHQNRPLGNYVLRSKPLASEYQHLNSYFHFKLTQFYHKLYDDKLRQALDFKIHVPIWLSESDRATLDYFPRLNALITASLWQAGQHLKNGDVEAASSCISESLSDYVKKAFNTRNTIRLGKSSFFGVSDMQVGQLIETSMLVQGRFSELSQKFNLNSIEDKRAAIVNSVLPWERSSGDKQQQAQPESNTTAGSNSKVSIDSLNELSNPGLEELDQRTNSETLEELQEIKLISASATYSFNVLHIPTQVTGEAGKNLQPNFIIDSQHGSPERVELRYLKPMVISDQWQLLPIPEHTQLATLSIYKGTTKQEVAQFEFHRDQYGMMWIRKKPTIMTKAIKSVLGGSKFLESSCDVSISVSPETPPNKTEIKINPQRLALLVERLNEIGAVNLAGVLTVQQPDSFDRLTELLRRNCYYAEGKAIKTVGLVREFDDLRHSVHEGTFQGQCNFYYLLLSQIVPMLFPDAKVLRRRELNLVEQDTIRHTGDVSFNSLHTVALVIFAGVPHPVRIDVTEDMKSVSRVETDVSSSLAAEKLTDRTIQVEQINGAAPTQQADAAQTNDKPRIEIQPLPLATAPELFVVFMKFMQPFVPHHSNDESHFYSNLIATYHQTDFVRIIASTLKKITDNNPISLHRDVEQPLEVAELAYQLTSNHQPLPREYKHYTKHPHMLLEMVRFLLTIKKIVYQDKLVLQTATA